MAEQGATPMIRHYRITPGGLDQCAFRLLVNSTQGAVLPQGSLIFFQQSGQMLEASYRGGVVRRGHILGRTQGDHVQYLWHACARVTQEAEGDVEASVQDALLLSGSGELRVVGLDDGRRELVEESPEGEIVLRMREV